MHPSLLHPQPLTLCTTKDTLLHLLLLHTLNAPQWNSHLATTSGQVALTEMGPFPPCSTREDLCYTDLGTRSGIPQLALTLIKGHKCLISQNDTLAVTSEQGTTVQFRIQTKIKIYS